MESIRRLIADCSSRTRILVGFIAVSVIINLVLVGLFLWLVVFKPEELPEPWRYFTIDYERNVFIMDGEPFYFVSGEFHYFRAPRQRWRNILQKMRIAGLNCVSTSIEWSSHETSENTFEFSGDNDIEYFLTVAFEEDLYVILRPGPYINADRDFGGLPSWLLINYPGIKIRTSDKNFIYAVENWFNKLFPRLEKYFYGYGGPVIMVQVENDYGSFTTCDKDYKLWLRDEMNYYVRGAAVLFTTDKDNLSLTRGSIPDVYATINFGPSDDMKWKFREMRHHSARGPLVNSQLYIGYPCYWDEEIKLMDSAIVKKATLDLLDMKANFIYYMFFGGTNFYFKNGASYRLDGYGRKTYRSICTSYDYDAPLDEAGDYTQKYFDILDVLAEHGNYTAPDDFAPKSARRKGKYGLIHLNLTAELVYVIHSISDRIEFYSEHPETMARIGLPYGYAFYITQIPERKIFANGYTDFTLIHGFADKWYVYTSKPTEPKVQRRDIRRRNEYTKKTNHTIGSFQGYLIRILVENQGRISYGDMNDPKGLLDAPIQDDGKPFVSWSMTGLPFKDISWLRKYNTPFYPDYEPKPNFPAFFVGELVLPAQATPLDTYIDFSGWEEGAVFINNCSLGRFWANVGPQVTVFVPRSCLLVHPKKNWIALFVPFGAIEGDPSIYFTDTPKWHKPG